MAAAVLALAISTSITVMQRAFSSLDTARNLTTASQILQSEIEKMRLKDWTVVSGYAAGPTSIALATEFADESSIQNRFSLQRTVTTPQTDMREITLTVTWRAYDGRTFSRSFKTYYSRYGLYDFYYNNTGS